MAERPIAESYVQNSGI